MTQPTSAVERIAAFAAAASAGRLCLRALPLAISIGDCDFTALATAPVLHLSG
jgi:hypothetical protein